MDIITLIQWEYWFCMTNSPTPINYCNNAIPSKAETSISANKLNSGQPTVTTLLVILIFSKKYLLEFSSRMVNFHRLGSNIWTQNSNLTTKSNYNTTWIAVTLWLNSPNGVTEIPNGKCSKCELNDENRYKILPCTRFVNLITMCRVQAFFT